MIRWAFNNAVKPKLHFLHSGVFHALKSPSGICHHVGAFEIKGTVFQYSIQLNIECWETVENSLTSQHPVHTPRKPANNWEGKWVFVATPSLPQVWRDQIDWGRLKVPPLNHTLGWGAVFCLSLCLSTAGSLGCGAYLGGCNRARLHSTLYSRTTIHTLSSPAHGCAPLHTHWLLFLGWTNKALPPSTTIEITCFSVASYWYSVYSILV